MGSDGNSSDGERHDGSAHDGSPSGDRPQLSADDATDADGDVRTPRALASDRLSRPGAILPGRAVSQSFTKLFAVGALLGGGTGLVGGLLIGAVQSGSGGGAFLLIGLVAGAVIGAVLGLICACGAAFAVLAAVWLGATERWAKSLVGAGGAALGMFGVLAIAARNQLASGPTGALLMLVAASAAALSISILDSKPRRAAAAAAADAERQARAVGLAAHTSAPSTAGGGSPGSTVRRGPPPIPRRPDRAIDPGPESGAALELETRDPVPVASDAAAGEHAHAQDLDRARQFRSVAVVLSIIGLIVVLWILLGRVTAADQQSQPGGGNPVEYQEEQQSLPQPAEVVPDESATQLSVIEVEAGMQTLLDVAVAAAGPSAVWTISNGDGTSGALSETPADAPAIVTVETCANNAGMSYIYPDVSFTTGVITDTSSDEHDREITDGNVAAAERIVAAWEALGYNEDSGLGGNIDLAGGVDLPATSLHVRYTFGLVTLVRVGQCLPVG